MKYLKVFENQAEESAWKESEEYIKTSLSMDKENMDELSYNSKVKFRAEYNLEGLEGDVKLMNCGNIFDSLKVNGVEAVTGSVEATREEKHYGTVGTWEDVVIHYDPNTTTTLNASVCWPYSYVPHNVEIEVVGDYTQDYLKENARVVMYYLDEEFNIIEGSVWDFEEDYTQNSGFSFDENGHIRIVDTDYQMIATEYTIMGFYLFFGVVLESSRACEVYVKGQILTGSETQKSFTVTANDFILDSEKKFSSETENFYYNGNDEHTLQGVVKTHEISHNSNILAENLGIFITIDANAGGESMYEYMLLPLNEPSDYIKMIRDGVYQIIGIMMYTRIGHIRCSFVDMTTISDGVVTNPTLSIIPTNITCVVEEYGQVDYTNDEICFTSATQMQNSQLVFYDYHECIHACLCDRSNVENFGTNQENPYEGVLSYSSWNKISQGVDESLIYLGNNRYSFPQSWIDSAQPIFDNGGKVLLTVSNMIYYSLPLYVRIMNGSYFSDLFSTNYSIIQESISGGAPKELSVDASVGKVSLIGEVNDYFSTLPSNGFEGCPLETVIIPDNVKSIETKCFGHCDRLKKVYLPQNMDKLADYSFGGNSVKRGNVINVRSVKDESPLAFGDYGDSNDMNNYIKVTVNLTDVSKPTPLWCNKDINYYTAQFRAFDTTQLKKIVIDGVEVPINQLYQFSSTGEHEVIYYFKDQNLNLQGLLQWVQIGDDNSEQNAVSGDSTHVECNLTSPLTSMHCFASCVVSLKSMTFTNIDTSICSDMSMAFMNCSGLTSLDVSNFDTSNVTNMNYMFYDCEGLTSLDVSNFDTSKVTNMEGMFEYCSGLTSVTFGENFDTSNVTSMRNMFDGCGSLTSIDVSNFDTSNVTNMVNMFYRCSGLTSLDLSNFDTSAVTNMEGMFRNCVGLTSVTMVNSVSALTTKLEMFNGITTTGTFYYNGNYDYSKIIAELPSTWTAVDINGTHELYEWVDLGLPSGLKWAAWNVGATKPEEYGLYFAWGETQGYAGPTAEKGFYWGDYQFTKDACTGTTDTSFRGGLTKYNNNSASGVVDNLTTLELSDDAAYLLDNTCRIPTIDEFKELTANTTSEWIDDYNGTGVPGYIFTSNVNGNSIFVPAAGICIGGSVSGVGLGGVLWSSSLYSSGVQFACLLDFYSDGVDVGNGLRCYGLPLRPVKG